MNDNHPKILLYFLLFAFIAFAGWSIFSGKDSRLQDAIGKLEEARTRIDSARISLNNVITESNSVLQRNADFKNYISAVDSVVRLSDAQSRVREQRYLQSLNRLDQNIEKLKTELAGINNKLPELENGQLSNNP